MVAGAVSLSCGAARAQGMPEGTDRFSLAVRGQVTYESNVSGGNDAVAAARDVEPEDVIYTVGTSMQFQLPSSRRTLFLSGSANVNRHANNRNLDGEDYAATAGATTQLGACGGTLIGSYARRQTLTQDIALPVASNTAETTSTNVSVTCGRRGIVTGLSAGLSRLNNAAKTLGFVDSETRTAAVTVGYQNQTLGNLSAFLSYSEVSYDETPMTMLGAPRGFEQTGGGLSYSRKIGNRLNGAASLSYVNLRSSGAGTKSNNLAANVSMNYQASPRTMLSVSYALSNNATSTINADFVRTEAVRVSGSYKLNSRINLQAGGSMSRDNYRGGVPIGFQLRKSEQTTIFGGASVRIGRKIVMTLNASHTERDADLGAFDYDSNRVSLGVTGTF